MADPNIEILRKETCCAIVQNSIGSRTFNSSIVRYKDSGTVADIFNDGEYSCAFFVSAVLLLVQAIDRPRATVQSLKKSLEANPDWQKVEIEDRESGDVVFYEKTVFEDGSENAHVGFVISKDEAVSTDYKTKTVIRHPIGLRPIEMIYRYSWPPTQK